MLFHAHFPRNLEEPSEVLRVFDEYFVSVGADVENQSFKIMYTHCISSVNSYFQ